MGLRDRFYPANEPVVSSKETVVSGTQCEASSIRVAFSVGADRHIIHEGEGDHRLDDSDRPRHHALLVDHA